MGLALSRASSLPQRFQSNANCVNNIKKTCGSELGPGGVPTMASDQPLHYADLAMINPVSLAASNRIATNFDVGVWLPSPVLSSGTNGFTSG